MLWIRFKPLRKLNIRSIQANIALAFSVLIIITVGTMAFVTYRLSADAVRKNSSQYTLQLIDQVNDSIGSYVSYMDNISQMVLYNSDIRNYLTGRPYMDEWQRADLEHKIYSQFKAIASTRQDIASIVVFDKGGHFIANRANVTLNPSTVISRQEWYKKAVEKKGEAYISPSHVQNVFANEYSWVVSLSRELTDDDGNSLGVFLVDLNYSVINNMCKKIELGDKGYIFIIDDQGNIVYHPQQQLLYSRIKTEMIDQVLISKAGSFYAYEGSRRKLYTIRQSAFTGWKIVGVTYPDELISNKRQMQSSYLYIGGIFLLISLVISILISFRISRPVKRLEATMRKAEAGDFEVRSDVNSSNEIGELSRAFNIMIAKIHELMLQNVHEQELKRKSELRALQAQINPHFLYNTLDSIIWMAESRKTEEVVLMTSALSKLFRLSISKGEEIITIRNEIEHIKSYLTIQKMRYRDKLDFSIEVDEEILSNKVLKILLQPLVENAIYHGIKNRDDVGLIQIKGSRHEDRILLQVIDNGSGMAEEEIRTIFDRKPDESRGSGVGVKNVNERIRLYFGEEYGLTYQSEVGVGTTANVWLPLM